MIARARLGSLFTLSIGLLAACSTPAATEGAETQEQAAVSDIARMTSRGDGTFDVECHDGTTEVVSAVDVQEGRVCKPAVFPSSPFASGACTGTPMTAADAAAMLATANAESGAPSGSAVAIGSYVLGLRRRDTDWSQNSPWANRDYWVNAPNDALSAWRETGVASSSGRRAVFSGRGNIELAADASGAPYLRMVGEAANEVGPDTTRFLRLVSKPMQPWAFAQRGPDFELESKVGNGAWSTVTEHGWTVQTTEHVLIGTRRSWWFQGSDVTAIVTSRCGQFVSAQPVSSLSPVRAAIGVAIVLAAP